MAKKPTKRKTRKFIDTFAIYYSDEDQRWIAHSLRTDQFGTGDCVVDALADGMKAVDQVVALAEKQPNIQIFCDAPEEIHQIAKTAKRLPDELFEIAHKKLYGEWPDYLKIEVDVQPSFSFTRKIREVVCA